VSHVRIRPGSASGGVQETCKGSTERGVAKEATRLCDHASRRHGQVLRWMGGTATSPAERLERDRVRAMVGAPGHQVRDHR
jgi:hypothetical protein